MCLAAQSDAKMAAYGLVVVICLASWYGVQAVDINVVRRLTLFIPVLKFRHDVGVAEHTCD